MRRKVFSSSRRRGLFCSTKRLVAWDTHYYRRASRVYGLVDFLPPAKAIAAPAPPPATTATIATLAPVDMPVFGAAAGGVFAGAAVGGAAAVGVAGSVCAPSTAATLKKPPGSCCAMALAVN